MQREPQPYNLDTFGIMKPPLDRIKVTQRAKDILLNLRRRTGIEHWNVLCRWALCDSLANPNHPIPLGASNESNVEMSWDVFAGEQSSALLAALSMRAKMDGIELDKGSLANYFKLHLERGISQLHTVKNLGSLLARGTHQASELNGESEEP